MTQRVSSIRRFRRHYSSETIAFRFRAIHIEKRRVDSQSIARHAGQALNVKWRTCLWVFPDSWNMICPKDKDSAPVRLNKVVAEFVHKYLVARIDCAPGNNLAAPTNATRKNFKIMTERVGRRIY